MNPENEERLLKALESIADSLGKISRQLSPAFEFKSPQTIANSLRDICQHLSHSANYYMDASQSLHASNKIFKYFWSWDEAADELKISIRTLRKHCQSLGINVEQAELGRDDLDKLGWEIEKAADARIANLKQVEAPTAKPNRTSWKKKGRLKDSGKKPLD